MCEDKCQVFAFFAIQGCAMACHQMILSVWFSLKVWYYVGGGWKEHSLVQCWMKALIASCHCYQVCCILGLWRWCLLWFGVFGGLAGNICLKHIYIYIYVIILFVMRWKGYPKITLGDKCVNELDCLHHLQYHWKLEPMILVCTLKRCLLKIMFGWDKPFQNCVIS